MSSKPATDEQLLLGDAQDFGTFYLRHERAILAFFRRRVPTADLAADLTAECFARALEGRHRFDASVGDPRGWLFGIARHLLSSSLQRGQVEAAARRRIALDRLELDDEALLRIDELATTHIDLNEVTEDEMEALMGRVVDGRTYAELAADLRCSEAVVRKRVSRALGRLRAQLGSR